MKKLTVLVMSQIRKNKHETNTNKTNLNAKNTINTKRQSSTFGGSHATEKLNCD